jgi:hypothetical protein
MIQLKSVADNFHAPRFSIAEKLHVCLNLDEQVFCHRAKLASVQDSCVINGKCDMQQNSLNYFKIEIVPHSIEDMRECCRVLPISSLSSYA